MDTEVVRLLRELVLEIRLLRLALTERAESAPLTSWAQVAKARGVSTDTIARRRAAAKDKTRAYFTDVEAAREWYVALLAPAPAPVPRRARPARGAAAVDWKAAAKGPR